MSNVIAETTEPRVDIKPHAPFCAVPAHEAQDAIFKAFPYEGAAPSPLASHPGGRRSP